MLDRWRRLAYANGWRAWDGVAHVGKAMKKRTGPAQAGAAISPADFMHSAARVARRLIGATLLVDGVGGVIVETEAYDQADEACHAFGGMTARSAVLFGPPAHAYVYRSYGLHWCLNFVCREEGHAAGVLIRALEPTAGVAKMVARRHLTEPRLLCAGPGRLAEALGVTNALNGKSLAESPFRVHLPESRPAVVVGPRIGISKAVAAPWRFGLKGSRFLSRPFPVSS
jgi:DNA-3-methyladenine glycosylase